MSRPGWYSCELYGRSTPGKWHYYPSGPNARTACGRDVRSFAGVRTPRPEHDAYLSVQEGYGCLLCGRIRGLAWYQKEPPREGGA